jgi:BON domain-containing protein
MKRTYAAAVVTSIFAGLVMVGSALSLSDSSVSRGEQLGKNQVVIKSVIKVHTDKGVITLPGRADSWEELENAEFVADSLADIQMVNNEVVICSSKE